MQTAPWGASRSCWRRARGNWGCVEAAAHTQTHGGAALYNSQGGAGQAHHNSPASDVAVLAPGAHKKRVCMRRGRCGGKTAVQSARRALRRRCRSNPGSDRVTSRQRLSGLQPAEAHVERKSTPRRVVAEARQVPTAGRRGKKSHGGACARRVQRTQQSKHRADASEQAKTPGLRGHQRVMRGAPEWLARQR